MYSRIERRFTSRMKSRRFFDFLTLCLLTALVVFSNLVHADEPPLRVAVTTDSLRFAWPPSEGKTEIRELPLHTSAAGEGHVLWSRPPHSPFRNPPMTPPAKSNFLSGMALHGVLILTGSEQIKN